MNDELLLHLKQKLVTGVLLFLVGFMFQSISANAQEGGTVSGVVVSTWDGNPLSSVAVTVRGTTLATQTGPDGRFELKNVPSGDQVMRFSKSGYASAVVTDVRVLTGQNTTVNGNLRPEFYEMEEYEVTAEEFAEQTEQILVERQQSSSMMEAIGSEQFSKLGAGDAAEALSKVTGASVADGKFAVIRGLADRYTTTTLNGNELPSADPDRKAAQLDLFPAAFIDRMDVSKTFTPDMAGGFAGGAINIVSKSYPDKFLCSLSLGTSYNPQANLRDDFLFSDQSSTDWLGMDDGKRAMPGALKRSNPRGSSTGNPIPGIQDSFGSRQLAPVQGDSPLNSAFSLTIGDSQKIFDKPFGYLAGITYKNDYNYYNNGTIKKYQFGADFIDPVTDKTDARAVIEYNWGAFTSLAFKPHENHEFKFNFMYVQSAEDEARHLEGQDDAAETEPGVSYITQDILHWTERNLTFFQLAGGHELPEVNGVRLDWAASTSTTTQDEPDQRIFQTFAQPDVPQFLPFSASPPSYPARYWRNLEENNRNIRTDLTIPLPSYNSKDNALKTGVAYSHSQRDFSQRGVQIFTHGDHPYLTTGDLNSFLDPTNSAAYHYFNFPINAEYEGEQTIGAGYIMGDWAAFEWLRLIGGVRYETTDISITGSNLTLGVPLNPGSIQQNDLLPSLGTTVSFRDNLLLRAAWSQTVVRPTYREIAAVEFYDPARARTYRGNPNLTLSDSDNYDLRLEWYPRPGELISLGGFYKKIKSPIELAGDNRDNSQITFKNFEEADVMGVEGEIRQNLGNLWQPMKEFTLGFNGAYIKSEVPLTQDQQDNRAQSGIFDTTRPMFDQPEYVINGDLTWDHAATGTTVTLAGGVVGRRLVLVGLALPDDYEEPAPQLDFFISQRFGKNWKAKFSAKNLLDPTYEVTQTHPQLGTVPIRQYTKGMSFGLSITYDF